MEDTQNITREVTATLVAALVDAIDYRSDEGDCYYCEGKDKCPDHAFDDTLVIAYTEVLDRLMRKDNTP